jgi:hypothetical protein
MDFEPVIYVADAGSVSRGNYHWVSTSILGGCQTDPRALAQGIVDDLWIGRSVALGYESPLFVPCRQSDAELGQARQGECTKETGNRPWSASAGATVLATGIQSLAWLLRQIKYTRPETRATTNWHSFSRREADLLIWEAFVSGSEKANPPSHEGDARLAMESFNAGARQQDGPTSAISDESVFSLAGAAILFAGLSSNPDLLRQPTLVIRPLSNSQEREVNHG